MNAQGYIASRLRFKGRLAVIAIAVSFFVMILSLAVSGGFRHEIRSGISKITGDIQLTGTTEPIDIFPSYYEQLAAIKGIQSITPVIW